MKKTILFGTCITLAIFQLASAQSIQSNKQPPQPNAQSAPPPAAVTKLVGKVELQPGQKMPFRLSFIDRKGFEEKRVTHPVSVKVQRDGTFEIPDLATLPEGYLLQSTPCVMPKAVTLGDVDILAVHSQRSSPFGTTSLMQVGGDVANVVASFADLVQNLKAGGVKWSGCGSKSSRGAQ